MHGLRPRRGFIRPRRPPRHDVQRRCLNPRPADYNYFPANPAPARMDDRGKELLTKASRRLCPELELASRHPSETDQASSKHDKRAGFRYDGVDNDSGIPTQAI